MPKYSCFYAVYLGKVSSQNIPLTWMRAQKSLNESTCLVKYHSAVRKEKPVRFYTLTLFSINKTLGLNMINVINISDKWRQSDASQTKIKKKYLGTLITKYFLVNIAYWCFSTSPVSMKVAKLFSQFYCSSKVWFWYNKEKISKAKARLYSIWQN